MTVSKPEFVLPIEAQGYLRLDGPSGETLFLSADGTRLRLAAPALACLMALMPGSAPRLRRRLESTSCRLQSLGLALDISINGRRVLQIGACRPNWLGRLLRIPGGRLFPAE